MKNLKTTSIVSQEQFASKVDSYILEGIAKQREGLNLSHQEREKLLKLARNEISHFFEKPNRLNSVTENKQVKKQTFLCFVTLYKYQKLLACVSQPASTIDESITLSTRKALQIAILENNFSQENIYVEINLLFEEKSIDNISFINLEKSIALGIDAIRIEHLNKFAIFKNSVPIKNGYSLEQTLKKLAEKCGFESDILLSSETKISVYKVIEFREDFLTSENKYGLYDLYRGNPVILQNEITTELINHSVELTINLLNKFIANPNWPAYEYIYKENKFDTSHTPQAVLRILASAHVLGVYSGFKKNLAVLESTKHCINKILQKYLKINNEFAYLEINNIVDIGTTGCLLLAINSISDQSTFLDLKGKLSAYLISAYDVENKKLIPITKPDHRSLFHESEYYFPGITLNALLQSTNPNILSESMDIAKNVFAYYYHLYHASPDGIKMMTWMTSAYSKLFHLTKNDKYMEFIFQMNDGILSKQFNFHAKQIDIIGSFSKDGSSRTTSAITESLIEAYHLARLSNDNDRAIKYYEAICLALRFVLQSQFRPDNTFNQDIIGGYKNSFFDANIRIDNLQHAGLMMLSFIQGRVHI